MKPDPNKTLIKDFKLAVYLHAIGFPIEKVIPEERAQRFFYFVFDTKNEDEIRQLEEESEKFWAGKGAVEPNSLFTAQKHLRSWLFSMKEDTKEVQESIDS